MEHVTTGPSPLDESPPPDGALPYPFRIRPGADA